MARLLLSGPVKTNQTASHRENVVSTPRFAAKSTACKIGYLRPCIPCMLRQHCSTRVKHAIGQLQSKKPPISNIDLDLPNQLTFGSNAEKISEEQRLEHQGRIQRWATVIRAVKRRRQRMNEGIVDHRFDLPKQVILRDHLFNRNHVKDGLDSAGL